MKVVRAIAIVALAFLGVSAIAGGVMLLRDPSGHPMKIPQTVLQHTPFHSFLIPGMLLLVSQGLMSLAVLAIAVFSKRGYGWWIGFQGCNLFAWITIEVMLLREVVWLHYAYWALGLLLIACGWALHRNERVAQAPAVTRLPVPSATLPHR
jgi:hypothetical protein